MKGTPEMSSKMLANSGIRTNHETLSDRIGRTDLWTFYKSNFVVRITHVRRNTFRRSALHFRI